MRLDSKLAEEYARLWDTASLTKSPAWGTSRVKKFKKEYDKVEKATGMPWFVVGSIHCLEASFSFDKHLHNGDSLKAKTRRVPAGRPLNGRPPFDWHESAIDAIKFNAGHRKVHLEVFPWHDVANVLWFLEGYNGWGYRKHHPDTLSPYLWSFTNHYTKGKYVADGKWSSSAVSSQIGAAAMMKGLEIEFGKKPVKPPKKEEPKDKPAKKDIWYWLEGLLEALKRMFTTQK